MRLGSVVNATSGISRSAVLRGQDYPEVSRPMNKDPAASPVSFEDSERLVEYETTQVLTIVSWFSSGLVLGVLIGLVLGLSVAGIIKIFT
jgi:hypothetical protein